MTHPALLEVNRGQPTSEGAPDPMSRRPDGSGAVRGRKLPISSGMVADRIVTRAIAATFLRYKVPAGRTARANSTRRGDRRVCRSCE